MWFKNLRIFRIACPRLTHEQLHEALKTHQLPPCARLEPASRGWISPYGEQHETLVHSIAGAHLPRYGMEDKVLPPAVLKAALNERLGQARAKTGKPAGRREKLRLKDEVLMDLLPKAFIKPGHIDAYLDLANGWLVVDSASAKQSEDLVSLLKRSVGQLTVEAPDLSNRIRTHMTIWLERGQCPQPLELGDLCDLRDQQDERAVVRCRHQDLYGPEIAAHLKAGKQAIKLGLVWAERMGFALGEDFSLGQLRLLEMMRSQLPEHNTDPMQELDAQFALMVLEFNTLFGDLAEAIDWTP